MLINLILNSKYYPILLTFNDFFFYMYNYVCKSIQMWWILFQHTTLTWINPVWNWFVFEGKIIIEMLVTECIFYFIMNEFL